MGSGAVSNMANGSFIRSESQPVQVLKLKWGVVTSIVTSSKPMQGSYMFSFRLGSLMMESSQDALYSSLFCFETHIIWPVIEWIYIYEFGLLGIVRTACFVFSMSSSPLRGWKHTHTQSNESHFTREDHPLRGFPKASLWGNWTCACRHGKRHLHSKRERADAGAKVEMGNDQRY